MSVTIIGSTARKTLLASLGIICVGLAIVGIFVPGLPTTVFVLAASYLFARSSPSLDQRLRDNRWLGASLRRFAETGGMSPRSKAVALGSMWGGLSLSWIALQGLPVAQIATAALGAAGTVTLLFAVRTTVDPRIRRAAHAGLSGGGR
jgi:uncharacterized membrane protein YbaN (DUF454 family)